MRAVVFPGQGAQKRGMGSSVLDHFADLVARADRILGYSVRELCNDGARLGQTQFTQPCLYVVNALSYRQLLADGAAEPGFVAGHSLGEYNALEAAGVIDFETGLRLVARRGELMGRIDGGAMAAVIGLSEAQVERVVDELSGSIEVANFNSPDQVVVSGPKAAIEEAQSAFEAAGAKLYIPLAVSGAFHSRWMRPAADEFAEYLAEASFSEPRFPVIANVDAQLYTADRAAELLTAQLVGSVRWTETVRRLLDEGVTELVEAGPGNVLTKLIAKIRRSPRTSPPSEPKTNGANGANGAKRVNGSSGANGSNGVNGTHAAVGKRVVHVAEPAVKPLTGPPRLGAASFLSDHGTRYACAAAGMARGISSVAVVERLARAGILGFYGASGLPLSRVEADLKTLRDRLGDLPYGVALNWEGAAFEDEDALISSALRHGVTRLEVGSYVRATPALVKWRTSGLSTGPDGSIAVGNKILARVSRADVAEALLCPAPERILRDLVGQGQITPSQAKLAERVPMVDDLCADSAAGSLGDQGTELALTPVLMSLRDRIAPGLTRVGSGDVGTPHAVAVAFMAGADFVLTDSINQCTVEAEISEAAKDLLQKMDVHDTDFAPSAELFELGGKVRVLRKGLLFAARANKLYDLYRRYESLESLDADVRRRLEKRVFRKRLDEVAADVAAGNSNPKQRLALVFKWYLEQGHALAARGDAGARVDFQIRSRPALGAFNAWAEGTPLEHWRQRHVDEIAERLFEEAGTFVQRRIETLSGTLPRTA